jgi:glycosyltransferase involved in cell wall biosynthesis
MRVAFISVSDQMGGSETMLLQIVQELRISRPSWDLHLILPGDGPLGRRAEVLGVHVTRQPMPESLRKAGEWAGAGVRRAPLAVRLARAALDVPRYQRALARTLHAMDPDVIHSNGFKAHVIAARLRRRRAALVWHMHEYVSARPVTRVLVRWYARYCDAIVANSASVADDVRAVVGGRVPVQVIHNAVDIDRFSPSGPVANLDALAAMPAAPEGTVRVGLVATFSRWKGHETFLRAIAEMPESARVRGYVVGGALYDTDGSQHSRDELVVMAGKLGVADRVGFTGFSDAPEAVMRGLDVVVHASTEPEAFGLVIAEAMACGRAVVTSGTGGAAEVIRDGEDALTHKPGDHHELASRLSSLAANAGLRRQLGSAARDAVAAKFHSRRLPAQFAAAYDAAIEARAVR